MANQEPDDNASLLMRLPFELHTLIIKELISSETYPENPMRVGNRSKEDAKHMDIFYPKRFCHATSSLSQTCRQLHSEIQALHSSPHQKPKCKLDLMVRKKGVWPTWTKAPNPKHTGQYDLDIELRLVDLQDSRPLFLDGSCVGHIARPLMVILNRLLLYGPQFDRRIQGFERLQLDTLTMTVRHYASNGGVRRYRRREIRQECFGCLKGFMEDLESQGFLFGKVQQMKLIDEELEKEVIVLVRNEKGDRGVKEIWKKVGFFWGYHPRSYSRPT